MKRRRQVDSVARRNFLRQFEQLERREMLTFSATLSGDAEPILEGESILLTLTLDTPFDEDWGLFLPSWEGDPDYTYTYDPEPDEFGIWDSSVTEVDIEITATEDGPRNENMFEMHVFRTSGSEVSSTPDFFVSNEIIVKIADEPPTQSNSPTTDLGGKGCDCPCNCSRQNTQQNAQNGSVAYRGPDGILPEMQIFGPNFTTAAFVPDVAQVDARFAQGALTPSTIEVSVTFDSTTSDPVYYDTDGITDDDEVFRLAAPLDTVGLPAGRYPWTMHITENYPSNPSFSYDVSGNVLVKGPTQSLISPGWSIPGIDRLFVSGDGAMWQTNGGDAYWFEKSGGDYFRPNGDTGFSTLVENIDDSFTLTNRWGDESIFDAAGLLVEQTDRNGNTISYTYTDGDGDSDSDDISEIELHDGRTINYTYDNDRIAAISDFDGREITLSYDEDDRLAVVTYPELIEDDPTSPLVFLFSYTAAGLLESVTEAPSIVMSTDPPGIPSYYYGFETTLTYDFANTLASRTNQDSTVEYFEDVLSFPLIDPESGLGVIGDPAPLTKVEDILASVQDEDGFITYYALNDLGLPVRKIDALGNETTYERDADGRVLVQVDPDPNDLDAEPAPETHFSYDAFGNLESITFPDSTTRTWTYDPTWNVPDSYTDEFGLVTLYEVNSGTGLVDSIRQVVGEVDDEYNLEEDDIVTSFTYTAAPSSSSDPPGGLVDSITDPLGNVTTLVFNARGNPTSITYADGTADEATEKFHYGDFGLADYHDDELSRRTYFTYDLVGRLEEVKFPSLDGGYTFPTVQYEYSRLNYLTAEVDPLGRRTEFTYDERGRQLSQARVDGATTLASTSTKYDDRGFVTKLTDPLSRATEFTFDKMGRLTETSFDEVKDFTTDKDEIQIIEFDSGTEGTFKLNGNSTSATVDLSKLGDLQAALDKLWGARNTVVTYTSTEATVTFRGDKAATNISQMTISDISGTKGATPYVTTDVNGAAADMVNPTTTTEYDALGRVISETDARGQTTTYEWSNYGNKVEITLPDADGIGDDGPVLTWEFDKANNRKIETDANGGETVYQYNQLGQLESITWPEPDETHPSPVTSYTYDLAGNLQSEINPLGVTTAYEYDHRNRQIKITTGDPDGAGPLSELVTEMEYDDANQLVKVTAPGGRETAYGYDNLGRMTSVTTPDPDGPGGVSSSQSKWVYDAAGQLISSTDPLNHTTTYAYDELGNQVLVLQADPDGDGLADIPAAFRTFDKAGQLTSEAQGVANKEIQRFYFGSQSTPLTAVTGTFTLSFDGQTTGTLNAGDSAGTVQSALESLSNIGSGNILVSQTVDGYIFIFRGDFENETVPDITLGSTSLTTTQGVGATTNVTQSGIADVNELQIVDFGGATTGTFDLYGTSSSATVYNLDYYGLQSALDSLWGSGNTSLYFNGSAYEVTFTSSLAGQNVADMYVSSNSTDGSPSATTTTNGSAGQPEIIAVSTTGSPSGGTWQLLLNSSVLGTFDWDAANYMINGYLSNATVSGSYPNWTITTTTNGSAGTWSAQNYSLTTSASAQVVEIQSGVWTTGATTSYTYDNLGQVATETMHGGTSHFEYDLNGNLTKIIDRLKSEISYEYDFLNRRTLSRDALGGETAFDYDPVGNLLSLTDSVGNTTSWVYDGLNRVTEETNELTKHRYFAYDAAGNLVWKKDRLNRETTFEYDRLNRQVAEEWWDGTLPSIDVTTSTEGGGGNDEVQVVTLSDATGGTFTLGFGGAWTDALDWDATTGEVDSALEALSGAGTVSVSGSTGGPFTITFGGAYANQDIAPLFFQANNLTNADQIRTIAYSYNDDADLQEVSDPDATYAYEYDGMGRVKNEVQNITGLDPEITFASTYNLASRRTELQSYFDSTKDFKNTYSYDNLLRLTTLVQQTASGGNTIAPKRIELSYNDYGQFDKIDRFAATSSTEEVAYTTYGYDSYQRLTSLSHVAPGDFSISHSYGYDVGDRVTSQSSSGTGLTSNSTTYSYDYTNQLTGANHSNLTDETYEYDANGNRTMSGYVVDDNNQMTSDGTYNYTYDDEGNRLTRTKISNGYVTRYEWDHRNRLTTVTEEDDSSTVLQTTTNYYDPFNQWIRRTFDSDGPGGTAATDTFFAYESGQAVFEFDGSDDSDLTHRYLWGARVDQFFADEKVSSLGSSGAVLWGFGDNLGTPRDLVSYNSSTDVATIANHREYDSYGKLLSQSNVTYASTIGFTGRMWDATTSLQGNVNRWYDPVVGRWLSEDPIGFNSDDLNLEMYVGNNPVANTDPLGLFSISFGYAVDYTFFLLHFGADISGYINYSRSSGFQFNIGGTVSLGPALGLFMGFGPILSFTTARDLFDLEGWGGTFGIDCFEASANGLTNDPSAAPRSRYQGVSVGLTPGGWIADIHGHRTYTWFLFPPAKPWYYWFIPRNIWNWWRGPTPPPGDSPFELRSWLDPRYFQGLYDQLFGRN